MVLMIGNPLILRRVRIWYQFFTDTKPEFGHWTDITPESLVLNGICFCNHRQLTKERPYT